MLSTSGEGSRDVALAERRSLTMGAVRQHARLSVGVAAVGGGVLLLASNAAYMVVADAALSLVPLAANAALIFGGVMFLREWRRLGR